MNFTELIDELMARGADYLDEDATSRARAERWINVAYREILNLHVWPFLQASLTGADGAGLVNVPDLRRLIIVSDVRGLSGLTPGSKLDRTTLEDLARVDEDIALTGTPDRYYVLNGTQVTSFPLGGTIRADYIRRVPPMSGTDAPLFDEAYHDIIVDRAFIKVYKDSDNFEAAQALKIEYDEAVRAMAEDYQLESEDITYLTPSGTDL